MDVNCAVAARSAIGLAPKLSQCFRRCGIRCERARNFSLRTVFPTCAAHIGNMGGSLGRCHPGGGTMLVHGTLKANTFIAYFLPLVDVDRLEYDKSLGAFGKESVRLRQLDGGAAEEHALQLHEQGRRARSLCHS